MKQVISSILPVVQKAKSVSINQKAITKFAQTVTKADFNRSEFSQETIIKNGSEENQAAYAIIYNSVNFCYWGKPKWTITINRRNYDGSAGMIRALKRGFIQNHQLLNSGYLAQMPKKDLEKILAGNIKIPLFHQRLKLLRALGKTVSNKFDGQFLNIIKRGSFDSERIVAILVKDFPDIFNDIANYHGRSVCFYKRAQLVPAHLFDLKKAGLISSKITGYQKLTAFADYKVPQLLRKFGILKYSQDLTNKVDNQIEIKSGSDEEIEIRAATIWAIELATRVLKKQFPQASAAKVDGIFWFQGQVKSANDKPYHRTRTIWY